MRSRAAAGALIGLVRATNDVVVRIAPSLNQPVVGPRLRSALESLATALNSADGPASAKALDDTRAALDAYKEVAPPSEMPDIGAIEIAFTRVNGLLQRPCGRSNSRSSINSQQSCIGT